MGEFFAFNLISDISKFIDIDLCRRIPNRIDFRVDICRRNAHAPFMRCVYSSRRFIVLIFARNILPPALSQAIVRSVLSTRWIQIVLRQQGYNPVDIKLAILDFAKFALLDREEPYIFLR